MDKILCLTRGGKASYPNQDRAIALAKEREAELFFLYVTSVEFLDTTPLPKLIDLEAEMEEMGEFLLTMAQERAQKAGIEARAIVRRGVFRRALKNVIKEHAVTTVMLGSSKKVPGALGPVYIQKLGQELSSEDGVEFIVTQDGKITKIFHPE